MLGGGSYFLLKLSITNIKTRVSTMLPTTEASHCCQLKKLKASRLKNNKQCMATRTKV